MRPRQFVYPMVLATAMILGSGFVTTAFAQADEADRPPTWLEQLFGRDYSTVAERHTLSAASENGMVLIAQNLLDRGVDINTRDGFGRTPLIRAAQRGNMQMVRYLLDKEADFRLEDYSGYTALHWAIHENRPDIVKILLKSGADPEGKSSTKISPLDVAKLKGRLHIVAFLNDAGLVNAHNSSQARPAAARAPQLDGAPADASQPASTRTIPVEGFNTPNKPLDEPSQKTTTVTPTLTLPSIPEKSAGGSDTGKGSLNDVSNPQKAEPRADAVKDSLDEL